MTTHVVIDRDGLILFISRRGGLRAAQVDSALRPCWTEVRTVKQIKRPKVGERLHLGDQGSDTTALVS